MKDKETNKDIIYETPSDNLVADKSKRWQYVVVLMCFIGWVGSYFCRNHLYVVTKEFQLYLYPQDTKIAQKYLGIMLAFGYVANIFGKLLFSFITDSYLKSGLTPWMITFIGAPFVSILFAYNPIQDQSYKVVIAIALWFLLRTLQSAGWIGLVRMIANWIPYQYHGRVMAFESTSFVFGDAFTRIILSLLLRQDAFDRDWRKIFLFSACCTGSLIIPSAIFLRDSPLDRNLPMPPENPDSVRTTSFIGITRPREPSHSFMWKLSRQPLFYILLLLAIQLNVIREFFNNFGAMYLERQLGLTPSKAAGYSSLFPLVGVISAPLCGLWVDKIRSKHWRLAIIPVFSFLIFCALFILTCVNNLSLQITMGLFMICGFSLIGPYSLLAGVLSIDLGGHSSSALVSGIVDSVGYSGGVIICLVSAAAEFQIMFAFSTFIAASAVITGCVQFVYNYRLQDRCEGVIEMTERKTDGEVAFETVDQDV